MDTSKISKTPYIIITVILIIIIIGIGIFVWYSNSNNKYLFKPYEPPSTESGEWWYPMTAKVYQELTPEQAELREKLLLEALDDVRLAIASHPTIN